MSIVGELGINMTAEGMAALSKLDDLLDTTIEVGYHADQTAADGEHTLAEIAYWNHYGTLHKDGSVMIPARPFMDTLQKNSEELAEFSQQAAAGLDSAEAVVTAIGAKASSMIQDAIRDKEWAPNAPITVEGGWMVNEYGKNGPVPIHIEGKGSTKPLIDTGTMRQGCSFVVRKNKK